MAFPCIAVRCTFDLDMTYRPHLEDWLTLHSKTISIIVLPHYHCSIVIHLAYAKASHAFSHRLQPATSPSPPSHVQMSKPRLAVICRRLTRYSLPPISLGKQLCTFTQVSTHTSFERTEGRGCRRALHPLRGQAPRLKKPHRGVADPQGLGTGSVGNRSGIRRNSQLGVPRGTGAVQELSIASSREEPFF